MINKYKNNSIVWIDVMNPTIDEIRTLVQEYNINPDVARELQLPTYKEKIVMYKDYIYLVLHFPALRHTHKIDTIDQEIDFVVGNNFILTTRYESIDALERFSKSFELNKILNKGLMDDNAGFVLYYIVKELYGAMSDEVDSINDVLGEIDRGIFKGKEKDMVSKISEVSRDLISINHVILTHKDVLMSLKDSGVKLFGKNFTENFLKIINEYHRIEKILQNSIEFLRELRNTNDSLLTTKQNETIKALTFMTFLSLPFAIIANLFSMNTVNAPIIGNQHDWSILLVIQLVVVAFSYMYAKWRKWI